MGTIELGELLDAIAAVATRVMISYLWRPILRDPDDELVLETAVNGRADLFLTFNERDFVARADSRLALPDPGRLCGTG